MRTTVAVSAGIEPASSPDCEVLWNFKPASIELRNMATPRGIEPRSPDRQSGIITAILWRHIKSSYRRKPLQSYDIIGSIVRLLFWILKSRRVVIFQPHAYATPTSQESTSRFSGVGFFTLIQGISTATYLTLPRLPRRSIGPEPFQYPIVAIYIHRATSPNVLLTFVLFITRIQMTKLHIKASVLLRVSSPGVV